MHMHTKAQADDPTLKSIGVWIIAIVLSIIMLTLVWRILINVLSPK